MCSSDLNEFDGREIAPLDEIGVRNVARELKQKNITAAAISSVFSPVTAEMEQRAAAIVRIGFNGKNESYDGRKKCTIYLFCK